MQGARQSLKIEVVGRIRYPDAFVACTPSPRNSKVVTDPVVVFEVVSEGSSNEDVVVKNAEYRDCPSIQRYVILQQTHQGATVFSRKGHDWVAEIVTEGGVLRLPEIGIEFPLAEAYDGLDLPPADEPPSAG